MNGSLLMVLSLGLTAGGAVAAEGHTQLAVPVATGAVAHVAGPSVVPQSNAVAIATAFLRNWQGKEHFDLSQPWKVVEQTNSWDVWFSRDNFEGKPNKGLIRVGKTSGDAVWVPLR